MAREVFGGVFAAWIVSTVEADDLGTGIKAVVLPTEATTLQIYDAPDGALVSDFLDTGGQAVSEIVVRAGSPYIPRFSGPDGLTMLWVQAADGTWLPLPRYNPSGTGTPGPAGDVKLAGGNQHEYSDSQAPPWLLVRIPNDGSDSGSWSNRLEFHYWDTSTGQYRLGFHVNEKGALRARGVTPTDVPARFMAHPAQQSSVAILEVTPADNTIKLMQVLPGRAVLNIPLVVPYLVNPLGERLYWGSGDPVDHPAYASWRPDVGAGWINYNNPNQAAGD